MTDVLDDFGNKIGETEDITPWHGLHGPVTYMGQMLFSNDPKVMHAYWEGFCAGKPGEHFLRFNTEFPELATPEAAKAVHERYGRVGLPSRTMIFVWLDGRLDCWRTSMRGPRIEDIRGPHGKVLVRKWLKEVEDEKL